MTAKKTVGHGEKPEYNAYTCKATTVQKKAQIRTTSKEPTTVCKAAVIKKTVKKKAQ
jgi:hypothetical protein